MGPVLAGLKTQGGGGPYRLPTLHHHPDPEPAAVFPVLLVLEEKPGNRFPLRQVSAHAVCGGYCGLLPAGAGLPATGGGGAAILPGQKTAKESGQRGEVYKGDSLLGEYTSRHTGYPRNLLSFPCQREGLHPTQKPVDLFAYLIRTYTRPGQLVLDSCMGSGTTAVAAIREGRDYIGFEIDPQYYRTAVKRVIAEQNRKEERVCGADDPGV